MLRKINTKKILELAKQLTDVRVLALLAFFAVVMLVVISSVKVLQNNYDLFKKEAELEQQIAIQSLQNQNLELKNVYLETDEYLELTARRQFSKAKPGEKLYLIPKEVALDKTKENTATEEKQTDNQDKSQLVKNLLAWREFVFH